MMEDFDHPRTEWDRSKLISVALGLERGDLGAEAVYFLNR
jgi:hypothetical protein